MKSFLSSSSELKTSFSSAFPDYTFGKTPSSQLSHSTILGRKSKSPAKVPPLICEILPNILLSNITSNILANSFKVKSDNRG